jgi:hypothetical protein
VAAGHVRIAIDVVRGAKPRATADGVVRARVIAGGLPGRLGSTVAATT